MTALPTGTVTLVFTDIEGSTRLLQSLGREGYVQALMSHRKLLRASFARHGGLEVDTQGDSFLFAFASARAAVEAAAEAQQALAEHPWAEEPVRVRVGIHTGEPAVTDGLYAGIDVHRAARIMQAAHGGQVILSERTADLLAAEPPPGLELRDLGEHRLKDLTGPERLFQVGDAGFPPLKTISNTNLPRPASSFVGRERELKELVDRMAEARLLSLTGPAGSGKTRLALEAVETVVPRYGAGVFWVALGALREAGLVASTIAQTIGAEHELAAHIGDREMLLVLDNFEQVIEAGPELATLLEACPGLTFVVTSRERLRVRGELEYPVPPLTEPEAVTLFCERAQIGPTAEVTELCARLDNLPLAVELAAARTKALSPRQILERLSERLDLLQAGRDAEPRQRTLRTTIDWSHDLLVDNERGLFRRLSVFAGGCTLEAAEDVAGAELDTLQSLIEKSLVSWSEERYWMLETLREYARERLLASGEIMTVARRHALWYSALAQEEAEDLYGRSQADSLDELEREHDNFRAALTWAYEAGEPGLALPLTAALQSFWYKHGHIVEGRRWLEAGLASAEGQPPELQARLLQGASVFAGTQDDWRRAQELAEKGLALYRQLGDRRGTAILLRDLGAAAVRRGDHEPAKAFYEESAELLAELGERVLLSTAIANLGDLAFRRGDLEEAAERTRQSLALQREVGAVFGVAVSLSTLGFICLKQRRLEDARVALEECMLLTRELGSTDNMAYAFEGLAGVAAAKTDWERAARLLGRAAAIREATATALEAAELGVHEDTCASTRAALSEAEYATLVSAGRSLDNDDAIALALELAPARGA